MKKFHFASARMMAENFWMDRVTIKSSFDRELGMRKVTGWRVGHILSPE
jgi:hypothetical protein